MLFIFSHMIISFTSSFMEQSAIFFKKKTEGDLSFGFRKSTRVVLLVGGPGQ